MTIDDLQRLMPPPDEVVFPGSQREWKAFQKKTGLQFPEDYFTLLQTYGSGQFLGGEFRVANPFDPFDQNFAERELSRFRENKARDPREVPFPVFPEPGGLYPFGIDGNGNAFLWLTSGAASKWRIACFNGEDYSEVVNHSLTDFLVLMASNRLKIKRKKFWGNDVEADQLYFVPRKLTPRRKKPNVK